jgi:hypothetical protein
MISLLILLGLPF